MPNGESELVDENVKAFEQSKHCKDCQAHPAGLTLQRIVAKRLKHGQDTMNTLTETCSRIETKVDASHQWDPKNVYAWMRVAAVALGLLIVILQMHGSTRAAEHTSRMERLEKATEILLKVQGVDLGAQDIDKASAVALHAAGVGPAPRAAGKP